MIRIAKRILDKFGLNDWLTAFHHFAISVFCWWGSPHIFAYLGIVWTLVITFAFMTGVTYFFLIWASRKNAKGFLLSFYCAIFRERKTPIYVALFMTIPFLFIVYYKYNYHIYNYSPNKEMKYHALAISSILLASIVWTFFMSGSSSTIMDILHVFGLRL